jgi:hypothetical protein
MHQHTIIPEALTVPLINVPHFRQVHQHTISPEALAFRRGNSELKTTRKRQPSRPRLSEPIKTSDEPENTVPRVTRHPDESSGS